MLPSDTPAHHNPDSAATAATDTTASTVSSPTSAPRVALVYQFTHQRERGPLLGNPLMNSKVVNKPHTKQRDAILCRTNARASQ